VSERLSLTAQGEGGNAVARNDWAQRLQRVFGIDVEHCERCGGPMKVIASIEEASVINKILRHLQETVEYGGSSLALGPPLVQRAAWRYFS
jgi:hypothetical protein